MYLLCTVLCTGMDCLSLNGYSHNRTEGGVLINNDISLDWHNLASSIPYLVSHKNMYYNIGFMGYDCITINYNGVFYS